MAVLTMILRKMAKNKWLELSVLGGLILSVALSAGIPMYADAILQRTMIKELERGQQDTGQYPGIVDAHVYMGATSFWDPGDYKPGERPQAVKDADDYMRSVAATAFHVKVDPLVKETATEPYPFMPEDGSKIESGTKRQAKLAARTGLFDHIRLSDGRLPANHPVDGVYEVLVLESSLTAFNMVLGNVFVMSDEASGAGVKIKPVGVMEKKDDADPYWPNDLEGYGQTFFIENGLFAADFLSGSAMTAASASWRFVLDYAHMDLEDGRRYIRTNADIDKYLFNRFKTYGVEVPALPTMKSHMEQEAAFRRMLWSLYVPVLIMLAIYLYMASDLMVERQKAEIAVMRSRGASRLQMLAVYAIEGALLGAVAFAVGPSVGLLFTRMLGASSGFLEFVDRTALVIGIGSESYRYAAYAAVCSVLMTLVPVLRATRFSIVGLKQARARRQSPAHGRRFFWVLDIAMIAAALYGLQRFDKQRGDLLRLGGDASRLSGDPLFFLIPALFILGAALFLLRIYPLFIRLIGLPGRRRWPPFLYAVIIQVGRSGSQYRLMMLFLIMTTAVGLYSASAARTLSSNAEQQILYKNGTDVVLREDWVNDSPAATRRGPPGLAPDGKQGAETSSLETSKRTTYIEPPFRQLAELPGVAQATKVFIKRDAGFSAGKIHGLVTLMGVHTAEFGRTAWMRDGLLDHHIRGYLNLIAPDPQAVLVSRSVADQGVQPGDTIFLDWSGVDARPFTVYGVIDYWPTFDPNPASVGSDKEKRPPNFIVGHLDSIQLNLALEPYEVWLKLKEDGDRQAFYDELAALRRNLISVTDTREELIALRNDPFLLSVNGEMTLGFLISALISIMGFLLFWTLSITGRALQFGTFRAMGMSVFQLIGMLAAELTLTSGVAVGLGGLAGHLTSALFVRLFRFAIGQTTLVLPFQATADPADSVRIYLLVGGMIVTGIVILGRWIARIKIHQALKLGED